MIHRLIVAIVAAAAAVALWAQGDYPAYYDAAASTGTPGMATFAQDGPTTPAMQPASAWQGGGGYVPVSSSGPAYGRPGPSGGYNRGPYPNYSGVESVPNIAGAPVLLPTMRQRPIPLPPVRVVATPNGFELRSTNIQTFFFPQSPFFLTGGNGVFETPSAYPPRPPRPPYPPYPPNNCGPYPPYQPYPPYYPNNCYPQPYPPYNQGCQPYYPPYQQYPQPYPPYPQPYPRGY